MRLLFTCFSLGILLSSCAKQESKNKKYATSLDSVYQQEAMLADIPVPLYDQRILLDNTYGSTEQNAIVLGYKSTLSLEEIIQFYAAEMERLGWWQLMIYKGPESLLNFEKPGRLCTISIRFHNKKSKYQEIFVFSGAKDKFTV